MDYSSVLLEVTTYYINLLIIQYHNKPKAKATVELIVTLIWMDMIIFQLRDAFDWRTAIGKQLDIVADWVGTSRFYNGQLLFLRPWFSLIDWDSTPDNLQGGFSEFDNFEELFGGIIDYDTIKPTQNQLADDALRLMIGLKIIKNNINFTAKNIDEAIWDYFNGDVYTVWKNKTLTYWYKSELREVLNVALLKNVLPKPTGVLVDLKEILEDD